MDDPVTLFEARALAWLFGGTRWVARMFCTRPHFFFLSFFLFFLFFFFFADLRNILSAAQTSHVGSFTAKNWRALTAIKARLKKVKAEIPADVLGPNSVADSADKSKAAAKATANLWQNTGDVYAAYKKISDLQRCFNSLRNLRAVAVRSLESYERNIAPYEAMLYNMLLFDPAQVKERLSGKTQDKWPELSHETCT
jgi:hypothetical protein